MSPAAHSSCRTWAMWVLDHVAHVLRVLAWLTATIRNNPQHTACRTCSACSRMTPDSQNMTRRTWVMFCESGVMIPLFTCMYIWTMHICETFTDSRHVLWHCNTLQHTATHCTTRYHTATHCNTLQHTATPTRLTSPPCHAPQLTAATHCNTLQHDATRYNTLQHAETRCNTRQSQVPPPRHAPQL